MQKLMLFVQKECHREITNLLFRIFGGRDEVDGLEVAKVDVPAEDVYVQKLAKASARLVERSTIRITLQTYFFLS